MPSSTRLGCRRLIRCRHFQVWYTSFVNSVFYSVRWSKRRRPFSKCVTGYGQMSGRRVAYTLYRPETRDCDWSRNAVQAFLGPESNNLSIPNEGRDAIEVNRTRLTVRQKNQWHRCRRRRTRTTRGLIAGVSFPTTSFHGHFNTRRVVPPPPPLPQNHMVFVFFFDHTAATATGRVSRPVVAGHSDR